MFSGKDAANTAYPTQWALNPSAYQNVDSSQVDWAALAQQWIAMKEAAAIVGVPQSKSDAEEGEAPMEVENSDTNNETPVSQGSEWNASSNNWDGQWNQWGWGWSGSSQVDPKMSSDPSMSMAPMMDGYPMAENSTSMQGYTTGSSVSAPTFQHGYWTAPQIESSTNSRSSNSRSLDRRSKSRNKESRSSRSRSHRDKPPIIPPMIEPIPMATPAASAIDAAKRRQLPAWIREGLEKMEREKQKAIEREQEMKAREEAELEKKKLEEEELERLKAEAGGQPMLPAKSKFDTDSEAEESEKEEQADHEIVAVEDGASAEPEIKTEPQEKPALVKKSKEEIMQEVMLAVRRTLTEILLEVTDQEIHTVCKEELARYNAAQASRINAMKASKSKALAAITTGLGLGAYESSDDSEDESTDLSDHQLQEIIRRKQKEFERTSREIEAEVRRAEMRDVADENSSPVSATPERPKFNRSSATPPPIDSDTPEKKADRRVSKEKRLSYKSIDRVDNNRKLESIPEEKPKRSIKFEGTPSPQRVNKPLNNGSTNSSSNDSEDNSSSGSGNTSTNSEPESKVDISRSKKRKRRSSSSAESQKKARKQKKDKSSKSTDRGYSKSKYQEENEKHDKSKSKKRDDYYDKHKSSRSRDERSHRDRYREESDDDRPKKRSKRSRSPSYESRSGRRKVSRDRSEEKSRRRDKRSYDRESTKRDRSHDRLGRDYDRHDRYERSRDERRRTRSRSYSRHRR